MTHVMDVALPKRGLVYGRQIGEKSGFGECCLMGSPQDIDNPVADASTNLLTEATSQDRMDQVQHSLVAQCFNCPIVWSQS